MKSQLFIGGCSGSVNPASVVVSRDFAHPSDITVRHMMRSKYGHSTTAFGILCADTGIFVDNGTGIQNVIRFFNGIRLSEIFGLQTHYHADHRSGIQANSLLFDTMRMKRIFGPTLGVMSPREMLLRDFSPESWPVTPFRPDKPKVSVSPDEVVSVLEGISALDLHHPGGSRGYKIGVPSGAIVIATDCELAGEADQVRYAHFVSGASVLYADVQYRDTEYRGFSGICSGPPLSRKGWGHATPGMLLDTLSLCESVPKLILLGHHDPARSDADLEVFESEAVKILSPLGSEVRLVREGDVFEI